MPILYRYLERKFAEKFIQGEVLFRSLAYYRDLESKQGDRVRGDKNEGFVRVSTSENSKFNLTVTNRTDLAPVPFEMSDLKFGVLEPETIFISCFSLNANLWNHFKTNTRIKIIDYDEFTRRIKIKINNIVGKPIEYFSSVDYNKAEELNPVFVKRDLPDYKIQNEFRFAFECGDKRVHLHGKRQILHLNNHQELKKYSPISYRDTIFLIPEDERFQVYVYSGIPPALIQVGLLPKLLSETELNSFKGGSCNLHVNLENLNDIVELETN